MATTTTTTTPTGWAADAAFSNWQKAQQIAAQPYQQYSGNMLAGWNGGQAGGYNSVLNGQGVGQPPMAQAEQFAASSGAFQPQQVAGGAYQPHLQGFTATTAANAGPAATAGAQNFTDAELSAYMNPYIGSVVNTTLGQLGRQNDILQNQANAKASAAGAFGGSRQAIMNSENNRNFLDTAANTTANLYNTGFNTAQQAISSDQNRQAQTSQFNAGAQNQMAQYNAGNQQAAYNQTATQNNAAMANHAAAINQAQQFGLDQSQRAQIANQSAGQAAAQNQLQAANALNGMGLDQQQQLLRGAGAAFDMGQARTAYDQTGLDQQYRQWLEQQGYPASQLSLLQSGLNGYSSGTAQTSPYYSNTGANILAGTLGAGALGASVLQNGSAIASGAGALWDGIGGLFGSSAGVR